MSAHGISPAWRADGDGVPESIVIGFRALSALCELDFLGDIFVIINLGLICEIIEPPPNAINTLNTICSITNLGDINPTIALSIVSVQIQVTTP